MLRAILSESQMEVAAWYTVDGFTHERIAELTGKSRLAVTMKIRRINRKLTLGGLPKLRRGGVEAIRRSMQKYQLSPEMTAAI